jgi:hypothetical protein
MVFIEQIVTFPAIDFKCLLQKANKRISWNIGKTMHPQASKVSAGMACKD